MEENFISRLISNCPYTALTACAGMVWHIMILLQDPKAYILSHVPFISSTPVYKKTDDFFVLL